MSGDGLKLPDSIRYVARIAPVREVSLTGSVEATPWRERLRAEGLFPAERAGRVQVLLGGTRSRFKGIPFGELILTIEVRLAEGEGPADGVYLIQAYNTNRFFAWVERTCFATPYRHGHVEVEPVAPARVRGGRGDGLLVVEMDRQAERAPTWSGEDGWEGPVFLPKRKPAHPGKFFVAQIRGETQKFPFLPGRDRLDLEPAGEPALQWLVDSGLSLQEWILRPAAAHAKSKTYARE